MSVDQTDRVDFIGVDRRSGEVVLTISDHLAWELDSHVYLLQEKLNKYLAFIESGELLQKYPDAAGRNVAIEVICQFPLDENAKNFFKKAGDVTLTAGIELRYNLYSDSDIQQ